jgi:hypothetical protein
MLNEQVNPKGAKFLDVDNFDNTFNILYKAKKM